jgi:cytochrome c551/c552
MYSCSEARTGQVGGMDLPNLKIIACLAVSMFLLVGIACGKDDGHSIGAVADKGDGEVAVGDASRGRTAFASEGCISCHSTGTKKIVGPGLGGISQRHDEAYIRESILDSRAVIVDGFPNVMPDFSKMSEQKVVDLITYLGTLE